jgi:hypothetical protein
MSRKPKRRYASAAGFAEDLRRYLAGWPVKARPTGPTLRLSRWLRRKLLLPLAILALQAVIVYASIKGTLSITQADIERPANDAPKSKVDAPADSKSKIAAPQKTTLQPGLGKKR